MFSKRYQNKPNKIELIQVHKNILYTHLYIYSFQQDAFINRKVKETRRRSRMTNAISSNSANILQSFKKSSRTLIEKQSSDLVKPISNLLSQVRHGSCYYSEVVIDISARINLLLFYTWLKLENLHC